MPPNSTQGTKPEVSKTVQSTWTSVSPTPACLAWNAVSTKHLKHSREMFLWLLEKVRTLDTKAEAALIKARDYEELDRLVTRHLMTGGLPNKV